MEKFMNWMERYMVPIASKIGAQRHLVAIRDGFATIMPLMIIGSFGLLIHNFPIQSVKDLFAEGQPLHWLDVIALNVYGGSMFLMGLFAAISIGYALGKSYDVDGFATGLVTLASSLVFTNMFAYKAPVTWGGFDAGTLGWEPGIFTKWLGPSGLITILIVTLITGTIFAKLSQNKKLVIKLPDGVPPAVSRSFSALLPTMITLTLVGIVFAICEAFGYAEVYLHVYNLISKPLMGLANSLPVLLGLILIQQLLWFFGLHGSNILAPVINSIFLALTAENMAAIAAGNTEGINIINSQFLDSYVNLGGSGLTAALMIAMIIKSKSAINKSIRNVATGPAFFNINEPVIFGLPIVLNPIYIIPFILAPMVSAVIAYVFSVIGFVAPASAVVPWTCPPVISAFLATGQWQGAVVALINIAVSVLIYLPFVAYADKKNLENEQAELACDQSSAL
ncbi:MULTISPECIES: PTS sugar transporter subunit IIC [Clostridium]|jgi:PTS system cellobiose-specific IIC component|nr:MULTISPECIES: PTS sugar transporter subunit IIC [Clostridium]EEH98264.1 PTS system, lactose/cellobiose family IIC component [Clostridium sp. 7_2_43FAA]MBP1866885.1 PTS system cellobiose-specific IIC component [Clostridium tertium]MBS6503075.1 PTS sugar transporter subunit IIC [Clostridium sp.]MBU6135809.1 PTS sugar transporter subunit IIC [Clostridium tertium]MDB1940895.1 PTS sugar transporter subunit IIC [Clostridium tertium]